jgi:hypothetical protein
VCVQAPPQMEGGPSDASQRSPDELTGAPAANPTPHAAFLARCLPMVLNRMSNSVEEMP